MDSRKYLVAVSAAQLVAGISGQLVALRERRSFDIALLGWRGQPDRVARDSWLLGTGLSAPVVMLSTQAAAIVLLGHEAEPPRDAGPWRSGRGHDVRIPRRAGVPRRNVPSGLGCGDDADRDGGHHARDRDGRLRPTRASQRLSSPKMPTKRVTSLRHTAAYDCQARAGPALDALVNCFPQTDPRVRERVATASMASHLVSDARPG